MTWTCLTLIAGVLCAAPASAQKPSRGGEEAGACIASGSASLGTYFRTCVSSFGNVSEITGKSGVSNIFAEGYALCANLSLPAVDVSSASVGFNAPTTATSSSNIRTTADGRLKLTQTFTRDALEKEILITMTVRNQTASPITNVLVARFFDGDIAGTSSSDSYSATDKSVSAHQSYSHGGLNLAARTFNLPVAADIEAAADFDPLTSNCFASNPIWPTTPTPTAGDWAGWLTYVLGTINGGASKIVKFVYRIM